FANLVGVCIKRLGDVGLTWRNEFGGGGGLSGGSVFINRGNLVGFIRGWCKSVDVICNGICVLIVCLL
ncbi:hypothetical protein, partial [Staphylococcus aureus]|uniref:hypothetical protein n=1 Tax=Staphylococcus aureus TaxID=1280 RepID=UPI001C92D1A5